MSSKELKGILNEFLDRWTLNNVKNLTLKKYVGVGNKDTFCQWVETKTKILGSINGYPSIKFGIYERRDPYKQPKNYNNDRKYSWARYYIGRRAAVFEEIKKDIIKIIRYSSVGKFHLIDKIPLHDIFKWKVAFLYSNERLIPIYKREVLFLIAEHFGMNTGENTKISEIQNVMMANKPSSLSVFGFMRILYAKFGQELNVAARRKKRKGVKNKKTSPQIRAGAESYVASQQHNKIQKALQKILIEKHGENKVILEENYVDVKVFRRNYTEFYEVKSNAYASDCVREALGQLLMYMSDDTTTAMIKMIVVGQYPANDNDEKYIEYVKDVLKIDFDYMNVVIG